LILKTPVVFLIFRRPDLTARVFETIRQAQPAKLLIVADGARNEEEAILCQQTRAVTEQIDWDCEVLRNYSDVNLGCRQRISSGITWTFEQVEEAIILEDDCLPHPSFFSYCENLLDYYRDDERIMVISGDNFQDGNQRTPYSYYFSKYNHCWGWATWRRAWKHWHFNPETWIEFRDTGLIKFICDDSYEEKYWTQVFNTLFLEGKPNTWDYPWTFACWSQSGLTALPNVNLVSNIGFGAGGTHTFGDSHLANMAVEDIGEITHPPFVVRHIEGDRYTFDHHFGGKAMKKADSFFVILRPYLSLTKKIFIRLFTNPIGLYNSIYLKFISNN
jgi:hypothetical protein